MRPIAEAAVYCTNCGSPRARDEGFCVHCGTPFLVPDATISEDALTTRRSERRRGAAVIAIAVAVVGVGFAAYRVGLSSGETVDGQSPGAPASPSEHPRPTSSDIEIPVDTLPKPVAGSWAGAMDYGAYDFEMLLRTNAEGDVSGWIVQTDGDDPSKVGKEWVDGAWVGPRKLQLVGVGWAYRPDGWRDDTLWLTFDGNWRTFRGEYECEGCSGNPYVMSGYRS